MSDRPFLSVVVPAYNGTRVLPKALAALAASDLPREHWELIVVDDGSTDDTAALAAGWADAVVRLPGPPHGPAYGRNRGVEAALGDVLVFVDADVCVHPDTLRRFAELFSIERELAAAFGSYDAKPPAIGIAFGRLLDHEQGAFRWFFPTAAALALLAVWAFAKMRVRRSESLLRAERANTAAPMTPWGGLLAVRTVLRRDPLFARFMLWMFILGFGNLMMPPMLAIALSDQFGFKYLKSILITSAIPALVTIIAMPLWARFLDRAHVVRFRTIHSWAFVGAQGTMFLACWLHNERLLYVGAVLQGIGLGGGNLAWNLGHVDFAPPSETSQYMATHVTLNGLRGLLAPTAAVGLYHLCAASSLVPESLHAAPALLPLLLSSVFCVLGAVGFIQLRRSMGALAERANRAH